MFESRFAGCYGKTGPRTTQGLMHDATRGFCHPEALQGVEATACCNQGRPAQEQPRMAAAIHIECTSTDDREQTAINRTLSYGAQVRA